MKQFLSEFTQLSHYSSTSCRSVRTDRRLGGAPLVPVVTARLRVGVAGVRRGLAVAGPGDLRLPPPPGLLLHLGQHLLEGVGVEHVPHLLGPLRHRDSRGLLIDRPSLGENLENNKKLIFILTIIEKLRITDLDWVGRTLERP